MDLGAGPSERELEYLIATEWARTVDDVLWRRTKLGLHGGPALRARVEERLRQRPGRARLGPAAGR